MKSTSLILILTLMVLTHSYAQDPSAVPPPDVGNPPTPPASPVPVENSTPAVPAKSKKNVKSNIGDKSFMGDPDPLDVLEPKKQNNLSTEASEPVFEEITDILDEKPKKKSVEKKSEELKPPEVVPLDTPSVPVDANAQAPAPSAPPNQEPPKPDILTEGFQTPNPEVTPSEPTVVVDVEKPSDLPRPPKKKKLAKVKKADPLAADLIAGDDPDFKREEKFNRLYKKYNVNPTDEAEWGGVSNGRRSMNYEIQKGDTLSDVSSTLFGDPKFWPKVWSLNSGAITNPHIILPKQILKFFPGTVDQPPAFDLTEAAPVPAAPETTNAADGAAVVAPTEAERAGMGSDTKEVPDQNAKNQAKEASAYTKDTDMDALPSNESKTPLLRILPDVFRRPIAMTRQKSNAKVDFEDIFQKNEKALNFYISYQISKKEELSVGEIIAGVDGRQILPDFVECTVQMRQSTKPNAIFYASEKVTDEGFGKETTIYENLGELEIIDVVNPAENIYRARVRKTIGALTVGSKVFPGALPTFNIREKTAGSVLKAKILGAAHDENSQVIGANSFVVIEGGANLGLIVGQEFAVMENQLVRTGDPRILQNERKIGKVHIVQVTEELSTAFVVTSETEIKPGDFIGQIPDSSIVR